MDLSYINAFLTSNVLPIFISALALIVTVINAQLTWKIVRETEKMREAQTEPFVSVITEPSAQWVNFIDMSIKNIGLGPAYNINFHIVPDFEYEKGKYLSEMRLIKKGIPYLAPNQEIRFMLTPILDNYKEKINTPLNISVEFKNYNQEICETNYIIDFSVWDQLSPAVSHIQQISESLQKIAEKK